PNAPLERFARDDSGWAAPWRRFTQLETHYTEVGLGGTGSSGSTGTGVPSSCPPTSNAPSAPPTTPHTSASDAVPTGLAPNVNDAGVVVAFNVRPDSHTALHRTPALRT